MPYAENGVHEIPNSLLLRADLQKLFDRGYVTVTPAFTFRVSPRLGRDFHNGRIYYALEGREIARPMGREGLPASSLVGLRNAESRPLSNRYPGCPFEDYCEWEAGSSSTRQS